MKHEPSERIADITFAHATGQHMPLLGSSRISIARGLSQGLDASIIERLQSEIPFELLCDVLGLSKTSLKRRIKLNKKLSPKQADNLLQLAISWHALVSFFNSDNQLLLQWVYTELPALDGATPAAMLTTNFGRQVLSKTLESMKFGEVF
jgi:putative toxin-antitoxin system antitoxin component (TIGR02293 family)